MPQRKRTLFKLVFLPLGLIAMLFALVRRSGDDWEYESIEEEPTPDVGAASAAPAAARRPAHRIALAGAFTVLFFAGASLTAGAGDQMVRLIEEDAAGLEAAQNETAQIEGTEPDASLVAEAPAAEASAGPVPAEAAPVEAVPAEPAPIDAPVAESAPAETVASEASAASETASPAPPVDPSTAAAQAAEPAEGESPGASTPGRIASSPPASASATVARDAAPSSKSRAQAAGTTKQWVVERAQETPAQEPEIEHDGSGAATVWLNRALPDPTPASARLTRPFARQLVAAAKKHDADWATLLAILRAQGERGSAPASAEQLDTLARRLAGTDAWRGALALSGRTGFADRTAALASLYRFVGLETLVGGYAKAKDRLAKKILDAEGVFIYAGGREDIARGRIDVRILALIGYLAERHGGITVSSLFSGHRMFSRPGVVSAHMYGHAVDIAAVDGTPILGNQQPGGLTEEAVRSVLLLPSELQPRQVISLLGLGGPSFPMRDHGDHVHVGY